MLQAYQQQFVVEFDPGKSKEVTSNEAIARSLF